GRLAWGNALEWQAKVTGRDLDPAALVSELTGRVGFELQANGTAQQASVNLNALNGTLRQQPLRGKARAQWSSDALRFDQLEIKLGASTLDARGRLSRDSDLLFALGIPNLAQLWPTAAGRIQINGRFTGTPTRPALRLDATGRALRLGAATLESATLRSRALGQGRNRVTLSARNLHAPSTDLSRLRLTLTAGLQGAVEASFSARSTHGSARLAIDGQWQGGRLKGRIAQFEVSPTGGAAWRLPAPSALTATTQAIQLAPTCLTDTGDSRQHLCIEGTVSRQGPSPLDIDGHGIPLAVLNPGLPQGYLLAGRLDLKAHLTGTWQTPDATARLTTRGASLHTPRQQPAQTLAFALEPLTLQLQNRTLSVGLQATLPASGRLDGTLQVNGFNTPRASLQGNLRGELPDLGFLQSFPLPVEIRSGSASLDIKTAGAADKPRLSGQARVDRLAFVLPLAGIDVTDGSLDLTRSTTTSPWRTKGSAHSGKGTLEWQGTVEGLDVARPRAQLTLSGHDFEALNLTGIEASVSPDMTVDLNPDLLKLRGRLTLDRLDVHVRRPPPEAISISPDTEVVGRQTEKRSRGPAVDAQLALDLGQNAHVSAYGLVGQIAGALELKQQGAQPPTAEGVVTLDKARYQGYGLDLPITSGRLLFAGPVDNPGLDITAERKTADVTARLHLTGTLREPVSQVSSEPALPQEEALSYLLTGHGLSDASRSDAALLVRAVASLHMDSEGGGLMNRLEQRTGLDEISVQGGESFDQTSLLLGKYLSPKLYLSYTQGMLKRMSSIGLRYQLTPQVQVQIDSGEAQAADVLYRLRY
ncbi:MAG: translocation/assembly module TamB domain-containing protein, partial [Gammaproteobacteria bacterium]